MESITIEVRPRLCAINASICLKNRPNSSFASVKLIENFVQLDLGEKSIRLKLHPIKIIPSTLSSLRISNNWISFRVQTNPTNSAFGSFKAGIIEAGNPLSNPFSGLKGLELPNDKQSHTLRCSNCQAPFTKSLMFKRVLPLPSDDFDASEWFCCSHNDLDLSILQPRETDYFYSSHYCVLNKRVFLPELKESNSSIHCHRCFCTLGSRQDSKCWKIWNYAAECESGDEKKVVVKATCALDDFLFVLKDLIGMFIGEQILLQALDKDRVCYLLLKPMEFKVDLLVEPDDKIEGDEIDVKQTQVMKVLYICGENKESIKQEYPNAKYCNVAPKVLAAGLDYLSSSTKRFPVETRIVDGYFIGYLPLLNYIKK